ncbi:hypothetical protein HYV80_04725 [Candidatus Woesearchaeota archaeon]|nr:hypothetical protein [Candidatus Woesearchaeota archaeon]
MGFLKFLKREKKADLDELDLPPAPPSLGNAEGSMDLPEFPEFPEEKISAPKDMPNFDMNEEPLPEIPELENPDIRAVEAPAAATVQDISATMTSPNIPEPMAVAEPEEENIAAPEEPKFTQMGRSKMGRRLFSHEKPLRERPTGKTIYVKVDKFKATLGSINVVRSDLKKTEEALAKLESIKNSKDRAFDRVKSSLDDLQKKLIFIDKTLFEGE